MSAPKLREDDLLRTVREMARLFGSMEGADFGLLRESGAPPVLATDFAVRTLPVDEGAVTDQVMASFAQTGSAQQDRRGVAPKDVRVLRDRLQVAGVHADSVPAQVVDLESLRDLTYEQFVGHAVGQGDALTATTKVDPPVPGLAYVALPIPAILRPKPHYLRFPSIAQGSPTPVASQAGLTGVDTSWH